MSSTAGPFIPLAFQRLPEEEMLRRAREFHAQMDRRRTTRHFSNEPVPRELIEHAIRTAGTAPSGAHQQPWTFVVVSDPGMKRQMREAAEEEERVNYGGRMPGEWLEALAPLGTDAVKEHITTAPYVVVLFRHVYGLREDGSRRTHYYTTESCGIAAGLFIAAIHQMGLATLTHAVADGISDQAAAAAGERKAVSADAGGLPRPRRARPRPAPQAAGRDLRLVRCARRRGVSPRHES